MLVLNNATVVTGDGKTVLNGGSVVVEGDRIVEVRRRPTAGGPRDQVVDLGGRLLVPGAINTHSHGGTVGPAFPSGTPPLPKEQALKNLDTHLRQGHTTVFNGDGFVLPEEVEVTRREHPINLVSGTIHFPSSFEAAHKAGGQGLTPVHEAMTVERMLQMGVPMIGEVGGGDTLGGGGMDYRYIPAAIERATGRKVDSPQARDLKFAVFGRKVQVEAYDREKVAQVLQEIGLADVLTPEQARDLLHETVLPSFGIGLQGLVDAGRLAAKFGVPAQLHNSAPSEGAVLEAATLAGPGLLVAGHSNHGTFTVEEALVSARRLREKGAWVEVSTLDMFGRRKLEHGPEILYAMLREKLVDFFSTDYAAGFWDGIYLTVGHAVADGVVSLPEAVALVSSNAVRALPRLFPDRGEIAPGKFADLVVTAAGDLREVERVYANGRLVVEGGVVKR